MTLSESLMLREDSSGALTIIYVSTRDSVRLLDLLVIPNQTLNFSLPSIPNSIPDIQFGVALTASDLNLSEGTNIYVPPFVAPDLLIPVDISEEFEEATFESGDLSFTISNGFPFTIDQGVELNLVNTDGSVVLSHITVSEIAPGQNYTTSPEIDLSNKTLKGQFDLNLSNIQSGGASGVTIDANNKLEVVVSLKNLKLKSATLALAPFQTNEVSEVLDFDLPLNAELQRVIFNSADFIISVNEEIAFPLSIDFELPTAMQNGATFRGQFNLQNATNFISLDGTDLDLTNNGVSQSNKLPFNLILSSAGSTTPITIDFERQIEAQVSISNVSPHAVFGYLGYFENLLSGEVDIDFFSRVVDGKITFNEPKILTYIENEFGLQVGLIANENLYVRAKNPKLFPGEEVDLTDALDEVVIQPAGDPGESQNSTIILDGNNEPAFVDFLSLLPTNIDYSFPVALGTTYTDYTQFAIDTSQVSGQIEIELPLDLTSENLTLTDTLESDFQFDTEYAEFLSGFLNSKITNYFPLEFTLQNYFLDSSYNVVDSLFLERKVINPGAVGANGKITNPFSVEFSVLIDQNKIENLQKARYSKPVFVLNTTNQQRVKIFSDTEIFFKLNGDFKVRLPNQ